jgi:glycosyltransferase involved in cell wall biosynthesis
VIGTAARLAPQKKLEELLQALRIAAGRLPPYVLRIAGGAERGSEKYAEQLRRLAARLPVEWLGELADTRPFLRELDAFVMISEPAGCPNASLEAMAVGLPVVATDVGGAGEQVRDGVTGRLVPRGDCRALAEALVELAHDADLRARYGAAGRAHVAAGFDVRRMLADYQRILGLSRVS